MSHLGVGNRFQTKDIVSALLSGRALDDKEEQVKVKKVDGRTKEYKGAVKRIGNGSRRKDGPDCRTRGYKATVSRIAARASKNSQVGEDVGELDKYGPIKGMDGPMWINNMVLYFDFKTSKFYDPKTKKHLTPAQEKDIDPSIIQ